MNLNQDRIDRIKRLSKAWADAEMALKIGEQTLGDVVIPAIKELRYAGRKLAKSLDNYINEVDVTKTDLVLEDAIFDCYRARHDATDAATAAVSLHIEHAIKVLGYEAVKEHFSEYSDLRGKLVSVRQKISEAREDQNGRHDIYEDLELMELPEIIALYDKFKANEPHMKDRRWRAFLIKQGFSIVPTVALIIAVIALLKQ